jgi:3-oxoacyl-[acyl-carrier-protein] synthase II
MFYLSAASTISHQPTFRNKDGFVNLSVLDFLTEVVSPNYKEFIDAGMLRRMSKILRMSVACAKDCLGQAEAIQPDAIIVGTGLGCLLDTEKFLNNVISLEGLIPPTSFIQSTHNTLAGQVSLSLGNHNYNMTHTQNSVSFEMAMQDAVLLVGEGADCVLVGAGDEYISIEDAIAKELGFSQVPLTSGTSFFVLEKEKSARALACVRDVQTLAFVDNLFEAITNFLQQNGVAAGSLDLVMLAALDPGVLKNATAFFEGTEVVDYPLYSGVYSTISAFALHWSLEKMRLVNGGGNIALVCNILNKNHIGLTLIESVEA